MDKHSAAKLTVQKLVGTYGGFNWRKDISILMLRNICSAVDSKTGIFFGSPFPPSLLNRPFNFITRTESLWQASSFGDTFPSPYSIPSRARSFPHLLPEVGPQALVADNQGWFPESQFRARPDFWNLNLVRNGFGPICNLTRFHISSWD